MDGINICLGWNVQILMDTNICGPYNMVNQSLSGTWEGSLLRMDTKIKCLPIRSDYCMHMKILTNGFHDKHTTKRVYVIIQRVWESTLWTFYNLFMSAPMPKLEMTIFVICNYYLHETVFEPIKQPEILVALKVPTNGTTPYGIECGFHAWPRTEIVGNNPPGVASLFWDTGPFTETQNVSPEHMCVCAATYMEPPWGSNLTTRA